MKEHSLNITELIAGSSVNIICKDFCKEKLFIFILNTMVAMRCYPKIKWPPSLHGRITRCRRVIALGEITLWLGFPVLGLRAFLDNCHSYI